MSRFSNFTIRTKLSLIVMAITCGSLVVAGTAFLADGIAEDSANQLTEKTIEVHKP